MSWSVVFNFGIASDFFANFLCESRILSHQFNVFLTIRFSDETVEVEKRVSESVLFVTNV